MTFGEASSRLRRYFRRALGGVMPRQPELVTDGLAHLLVESGHLNLCTSNGRQPSERYAQRDDGENACGKVFLPFILARVR